MTRQRSAARPGARWQPVVPVRPNRRVAGRRQLRLPPLRMPHWEARWRRYALPLLVVAVAVLGGWWLYRSPALSIRGVAVEGNGVLPADVVRQVADVEGQSILRPDFGAAEARLRALPLVKEADAGRDWPFGGRITIVERTPWGVWQAGATRYVIDEEGVVLDLDGRSLPAPEGAPVIVQSDLTAPLDVGDRVDAGAVAVARQLITTAEQTVGRAVVGLEFSQAAGLTVALDGGTSVVFGDVQAYEFKLAALFALLQRAQDEGRALHRIDLRFGDRVAVE